MKHAPREQFVIYSRKSRFTGKGESIENQIELCRQYLRLQFGDEAAEHALVYEDEGFSGGTLERPQFKRMMAEARAGGFRALVVYRLDRISRNIGDFARLIEELNRMGIDFISIKEQFDTSSPMGRAMMYISSVFSQLERETIAERIRDNMHELSKTGRWLGGVTPTGFASESVSRLSIDGKMKKTCKLRPIPEELSLIRLIFDTFMETGSLTKTETFLLQRGCTTKNGKSFTRFAIKGILSNPVYLTADEAAYTYLTQKGVELFAERGDFDGSRGVMAYNRSLQQPGKSNQVRPMEEWIVSVGEHPGLIEGGTWVRVQELLERNKAKGYRRPRSNLALLSGILICGGCGSYMRPKLSSRVNEEGVGVYSYLCSLKERSRGHCCAMINCKGNLLDAQVRAKLQDLPEDGGEFLRLLEQGKGTVTGGADSRKELRCKLEGELRQNEGEISGLISALGRAVDSHAEGYLLKEIERLHEQGEGLRKLLEEEKMSDGEQELEEEALESLAKKLAAFSGTVDAMSLEQIRAAVRGLAWEILWDGTAAHLMLLGSEHQYEQPRSGDEQEKLMA